MEPLIAQLRTGGTRLMHILLTIIYFHDLLLRSPRTAQRRKGQCCADRQLRFALKLKRPAPIIRHARAATVT